jgi:Trp operon repressor
MPVNEHYKKELIKILQLAAKDKNLLDEFLQDLLTPHEFKEVAIRWQIVKQLSKKIPHRMISKNLKIGISTITRGSRELQNPKGGFQTIIKLLKNV